MHYGDNEQLRRNFLDVILYKHGVGSLVDDDRKFMVELTSIHHCQYVNPWVLKDFLSNNMDWDNEKFTLNDILADDKYSLEEYYWVRLRSTGSPLDPFEIEFIHKADCKNNAFNGLH